MKVELTEEQVRAIKDVLASQANIHTNQLEFLGRLLDAFEENKEKEVEEKK